MWVIILLFLLAVILILVELFLVPGVGVSGVLSILSLGGAILLTYNNYPPIVGHLVTFVSLLLVVLITCFGLKNGTWKKVSLQETMLSTVNDNQFDGVVIGDSAITISRLAPMGKVMVNNRQFEAKSIDQYVDAHTEVVVVEFGDSYLIVKHENNK